MVGMGTNIQNTAYPVGSCLYVISNNTGDIWHSIHGKVKQHWGWVRKILLIK